MKKASSLNGTAAAALARAIRRSVRCFRTRTAQILNSGILEIGSIARMVQLFADRSSGQ